MANYVIRPGNIEKLLMFEESSSSSMSFTPGKKNILPRKKRQPTLAETMDYEGLELNIALYDVKTKKRKKSNQDVEVDEEGSFLLYKREEIVAAGNFHISNKMGEKSLSLDNINGFSQETQAMAVNALKAYSVQKGYGEILMPSS